GRDARERELAALRGAATRDKADSGAVTQRRKEEHASLQAQVASLESKMQAAAADVTRATKRESDANRDASGSAAAVHQLQAVSWGKAVT
ncbi:hypothetical protein T484DRAFT_1788615, partial [Baffinella frigidus]